MDLKKIVLIIATLIVGLNLFSQEETKIYKNSFELPVWSYEYNNVTFSKDYSSFTRPIVTYKRDIQFISLLFVLSYSENIIKETSQTDFYGEEEENFLLRDAFIGTGLRYEFFKNMKFRLLPYIENLYIFDELGYEGFMHNNDFNFDEYIISYYSYQVIFSIGLKYKITDTFSFNLSSSYRTSFKVGKDDGFVIINGGTSGNQLNHFNPTTISLFKIGFGFDF